MEKHLGILKERNKELRIMSNHSICITATGTILNPWYWLPSHITKDGLDRPGTSQRHEITSPCRVELQEQGLRLVFQDDKLFFIFTADSADPQYLVYPILYFLTYETFINYNIISPATNMLDASTFDVVDAIQFKIERFARDGKESRVKSEIADEWPKVSVDSIIQYLRVINDTLYYALAYYLVGCDNPRYFLIEFFKAVEVIKNELGGKHEFLKKLEPYGVKRNEFNDFGKVCNDMRIAPLDIGRHAPMPGAPLFSVNLRHLLVEPRSREVFESSTIFCRQVIDAYMAFLIQKQS